jgi:hypothetical protein
LIFTDICGMIAHYGTKKHSRCLCRAEVRNDGLSARVSAGEFGAFEIDRKGLARKADVIGIWKKKAFGYGEHASQAAARNPRRAGKESRSGQGLDGETSSGDVSGAGFDLRLLRRVGAEILDLRAFTIRWSGAQKEAWDEIQVGARRTGPGYTRFEAPRVAEG